MRRNRFIALVIAAIVIWSGGRPVRSQSKGDAQDEPVKLSTELVVVDAQVLRKKLGTPVEGLIERDFVLYEDGVKQQITHFSQDKLPLSIVLLLDISGSVMPAVKQVRDSGLTALNELKAGDEVALMAFGLWAKIVQDFTTDRNRVASRLNAIELLGPWIREGTRIDDAVYEAADYLKKSSNPESRRIVIMVTDNLSTQEDGQGHSEADAIKALHAAGATVCGLVVGDFNATANEYKKKGSYLKDSIGSYITDTGGILSQVDANDVSAKLAKLIERLRSRYSLGYTPFNNRHDGKFHNIKLRVAPAIERREGEIMIVARKGYVAAAKQ